ncbi:MAG: SUMF1/EgtB/PvdO family nonheme iron enzyme [Polyangiaceae bacterium]
MRILGALSLVATFVVVAACSSADNTDPRHLEDVGTIQDTLPKGTAGASNGDLDYCTGGQLCVTGEGDCDADSECSGSVCGYDNGPNFGMPAGWDVCVPATCRNGVMDAGETGIDCGGTSACGSCPTCPPEPNGGANHCTPACKCPAKEADCDTNNDCQTGLVCGALLGPQFGFPAGHDVCVQPHCTNGSQDGDETGVDCGGVDCGTCPPTCPPNGQPATCSPTCKCASGWGDCDQNSECQTGLVCGALLGKQFGMHPSFDVCVPPHCVNGTQDTSLGETGVDCGGPCGTCQFGSTPATSCTTPVNVCGPTGTENCCAAPQIPGIANFRRNYNGVTLTDPTNKAATVYPYYLDKFEVSVGRFRNFVAAFDAWRGGGNPAVGAGAHPLIANSGWQSAPAWVLAADAATLAAGLKCGQETWTDAAGSNEGKPINCVTWFEAFAFCAWDAGRMPTEAEWNAAAAGGTEERVYPWSSPPTSTTLTPSHAAWNGAPLSGTGTHSSGLGRWTHQDLAGNVWEWNLDTWGTLPYPCTNCANLGNVANKVIHGGSWATFSADRLEGGYRTTANAAGRGPHIGFRCARN